MARRSSLLLLAVALCAAAAAAGLLSGRAQVRAPGPAPRQEYDRELAAAYVDAGCWQCHAVSTLDVELKHDFGHQAAGVRPYGPDLAGVGALYPRGWHLAHLWAPAEVAAGSVMPPQRRLFDAASRPTPQGEQVVRFLLSLTVPSRQRPAWPARPAAMPLPGDAQRGKAAYAEYCAGCHGATGAGDGPAAAFLSPPAANLAAGRIFRRAGPATTRDDIYATITAGLPGSGMPSFAHLATQQRADLAEFVFRLPAK